MNERAVDDGDAADRAGAAGDATGPAAGQPAGQPVAEGSGDRDADIAIVGGGIVGLATAYAILNARPDTKLVLLEKEPRWALHQTGHNSGVIHSGLYYLPGSEKARLARAGGEAMYRFCADNGIPAERIGKLVVATSEAELPRLAELERRGTANGVRLRRVSPGEIRDREPNVTGIEGVLVQDAGITDYTAVSQRLAELVAKQGGELRLGQEVTDLRTGSDRTEVHTRSGPITARRVVTCGGLQSDLLARLAGPNVPAHILPFRGEYYEARGPARNLVNALVYPVPDPAFPFLGVHLTRMVDGSLHVGPNAVLAGAREGYRWRDLSWAHLKKVVRDPALRVLARKYWRSGAGEMARSALKPLFVRSAQRLVPAIRGRDLVRAGAGVRAQAIRDDGTLVDDFLIVEDEQCVHVLNAPSPAATASLLIGEEIARRVLAPLQT